MSEPLVRVGSVDEVRAAGMTVVHAGNVPIVVIADGGKFHALDNRCPHMGFPLHTGDVKDGLLACHWHHARFDVSCGATLDPWADDVDAYRVEVRDGDVFVNPTRTPRDARVHGLARLARGLDDDLALVIAKSVVALGEAGVDPLAAVSAAAHFGATRRADGWQPGLSILSAAANVLSSLRPVDPQRALFHSIRYVASDCAGRAPRTPLPALSGSGRDREGLRAWLRQTVEVRDEDGTDRVLRTLVAEHGAGAALDAVLAACTDHRYADGGHTLDYALKCAELVDTLAADGSELGELLFTSLAPQLTRMQRMEETSAWRSPVDVSALVADGFARVGALDGQQGPLPDETVLVDLLLGDDAPAAIDGLLARLAAGTSPVALADAVVRAAVVRVLRFGTANEDPDWDTVHHTLTYANAVAEALRRAPSRDLFRGVLDGAMSVYLDRFLNIPAAAASTELPPESYPDAADALHGLLAAYDRRSSVGEATALAHTFLARGGEPEDLLAALGEAVLREDSDFHAYQQLDIAWRQLGRHGGGPDSTGRLALVAAARWLAARYPTRRAREQTFGIARRLHRGEALFEDD